MVAMPRKEEIAGMKTAGGPVPVQLIADFEKAADDASMTKQRAYAAAMLAFVKADIATRRTLIDEARKRYTFMPARDEAPSPAPGAAGAAAQSALSDLRKSESERPQAPAQPARGQRKAGHG